MSAPVFLYMLIFFAAYGLFEFISIIVLNLILRNPTKYGNMNHKCKIGKFDDEHGESSGNSKFSNLRKSS